MAYKVLVQIRCVGLLANEHRLAESSKVKNAKYITCMEICTHLTCDTTVFIVCYFVLFMALSVCPC